MGHRRIHPPDPLTHSRGTINAARGFEIDPGRRGNASVRLSPAVARPEAQPVPDKAALTLPDAVWTNLRLIESDLAGFPPGEHIEEVPERALAGCAAYRK
jgi:hypothetical protein